MTARQWIETHGGTWSADDARQAYKEWAFDQIAIERDRMQYKIIRTWIRKAFDQ